MTASSVRARTSLLAASLLLLLAACSLTASAMSDASPDVGPADAVSDAVVDALTDAAPDVDACFEPLYGVPAPTTGLDDAHCRPLCEGCGDTAWPAPVFDDARIAALQAWTLLEPPSVLPSDPYAGPPPALIDDQAVCAVVVVDRGAHTYRLQDFASADAAQAAGAIVTHYGVCGLCSSLADLAVYARVTDLTTPVRMCGLQNSTHDSLAACIAALGFTAPCADIWAYNTSHTRDVCAATCFRLLNAPYQNPDGTLNACLQCDEDMSGPVFKAVAGRTRRNAGIASALCRPCSEVRRIAHQYE